MSRAHSNGRKARRRAMLDPEGFATIAGWCKSEEDLEECQHQAHDTLVAGMGENRVGPVRFSVSSGDEAQVMLTQLGEGNTNQAMLDHYRRLRAMLREYGGWIVVALAPARSDPRDAEEDG